MKGIVIRFFTDKNYGFIEGENGKTYFLHPSKLLSSPDKDALTVGVTLEFDELVTVKGLQAINIELKQTTAKYELYFGVKSSRSSSIEDYEILDSSIWYVTGSSRGDPKSAKAAMHYKARELGANAVLDYRYFSTTGSESGTSPGGVHHFTIHNYRGRVALIGRRSLEGKHTPEDLQGSLDNKAADLKNKLRKKTMKARLLALPIPFICSLLGMYAWEFYPSYHFNPITYGIAAMFLSSYAIYYFLGTMNYHEWLTKAPYDYLDK